MTEYIDIKAEATDDPDSMLLLTNLNLTTRGEDEIYATAEEGGEGSPLAQALFDIPGLAALTLTEDELIVTREPDVEWPALIADITDVLKDFFF